MVMTDTMVVGDIFTSGATNPLRKFAVNSFIIFLNGVCRFYGWRIGGCDGISSTCILRVILVFSLTDLIEKCDDAVTLTFDRCQGFSNEYASAAFIRGEGDVLRVFFVLQKLGDQRR